MKRRMTVAEPTNPCSSPTVQKIKSVSCSGTYFSFVCVPFKKPLPKSPPDPMAILPLVYIVSGTCRIIFHSQQNLNADFLVRFKNFVENIVGRKEKSDGCYCKENDVQIVAQPFAQKKAGKGTRIRLRTAIIAGGTR